MAMTMILIIVTDMKKSGMSFQMESEMYTSEKHLHWCSKKSWKSGGRKQTIDLWAQCMMFQGASWHYCKLLIIIVNNVLYYNNISYNI